MRESAEVAGAILPVADYPHLLVVEAAPESEATRSFKNVARFVYRLVQDIRWSGDDRTVSVRILGDDREAAAVAANVGLLLASLVDVAVGADPYALLAFDLPATMTPRQGDDLNPGERIPIHENPRDRLWLVPHEDLDKEEAVARFDITIGRSAERQGVRVDLMLVAMPHDETHMREPRDPGPTEIAALLIDAPTPEHPAVVPVAG